MVGVPRSKGCRICVQRRVKCDQTRPTCKNCAKGNRPCPGYNQELVFQDEGDRLRRRYAGPYTSENPGDVTADLMNTDETTVSDDEVDFYENTSLDPGRQIWQPINARQQAYSFSNVDILDQDCHCFPEDILFSDLDKVQPLVEDGDDRQEIWGVYERLVSQRSSGNQDPPFMGGECTTMSSLMAALYAPDLVQNQLLMVFKESIAPSNTNLMPQQRSHDRWLSYLPTRTGTNLLLDTAVRAVTMVHLGRLSGAEKFVQESRPYYGKALRLMNRTLQSPVKGQSSETLCATVLLSFYEMFASDRNDTWIRHAGGVSALMRTRGPAKHRYGFDREIYLAYRYTLIIEAFQGDQPCFLNEPEWQELSRNVHEDLRLSGVSKERMALFDLAEDYYHAMLAVPAVAAEARKFWFYNKAIAERRQREKLTGETFDQDHSLPQKPQHSKSDLVGMIWTARKRIKDCFTKFQAALMSVGHAPTVTIDDTDPLIKIHYNFINTFVSAIFTGYWSVLIGLNLCCQGIQSDDTETVDQLRAESREASLNICRSCRCMLKSSFLGPFFVIFGLRTGLLVFENEINDEFNRGLMTRAGGLIGKGAAIAGEGISETIYQVSSKIRGEAECEWILRKLFEIGERHMGMAKHIPGYQSGMSIEQLIASFRKRTKLDVPDSREHDTTNTSTDGASDGRTISQATTVAAATAHSILKENPAESRIEINQDLNRQPDHYDLMGNFIGNTNTRDTTVEFFLVESQQNLQQPSWQDLQNINETTGLWDGVDLDQEAMKILSETTFSGETPTASTSSSEPSPKH